MNCTRTAPKTHWTNVGYTAAKRGLTFDQIKVQDHYLLANEWIREGMEKWLRKATRLGMRREDGRS